MHPSCGSRGSESAQIYRNANCSRVLLPGEVPIFWHNSQMPSRVNSILVQLSLTHMDLAKTGSPARLERIHFTLANMAGQCSHDFACAARDNAPLVTMSQTNRERERERLLECWSKKSVGSTCPFVLVSATRPSIRVPSQKPKRARRNLKER